MIAIGEDLVLLVLAAIGYVLSGDENKRAPLIFMVMGIIIVAVRVYSWVTVIP